MGAFFTPIRVYDLHDHLSACILNKSCLSCEPVNTVFIKEVYFRDGINSQNSSSDLLNNLSPRLSIVTITLVIVILPDRQV